MANVNAFQEVKKLTDIKVKINAKKQQINQLQLQEKGIDELLTRLNKKIDRNKDLLRNIKHNIRKLKQDLKKTSLEINQRKSEITSQAWNLKEQLRSAYILGYSKPIKLFLTQEKADKLSRIIVYYDYFNEWRRSKLAALKKQLVALNSLKGNQVKQSKNLILAQAGREEKKKSLDDFLAERKYLQARIKQEVVSEKSNLAKLEADEKRLVQLVKIVQQKQRIAKNEFMFPRDQSLTFNKLKGKLPWPLPIEKLQINSNKVVKHMGGVLIQGLEGDEVRSVASGEVMYAEWLRGYGLLIILDHGYNFLTLYAFNQTIFKKKGQKVAPGEVIAKVGSTGGKYISKLYFSIRKGSKPEDPYTWLKH